MNAKTRRFANRAEKRAAFHNRIATRKEVPEGMAFFATGGGRPEITGGKPRVPNIGAQGLSESDERYVERLRIQRIANARTKLRKTIARAGRRRNRR